MTDETELVTMRKEDVEFLRDLAREIKTQDNRATADPYFYVVRTIEHLPAPDGYGERTVWVDFSDDPRVYLSKEEFYDDYRHDNYPISELEEAKTEEEKSAIIQKFEAEREEAWESLEEQEEHDVIREANVFFTQRAYEEHMRLNGHNYHWRDEKPYSYVKHAFRNPEIKRLLEIIGRFSEHDENRKESK